jgi:hypothetical protein
MQIKFECQLKPELTTYAIMNKYAPKNFPNYSNEQNFN